ncbi:MAG: Crp/Fnr family transcriptional regulator [Candidatus Sulfotelmatobacter sp.]
MSVASTFPAAHPPLSLPVPQGVPRSSQAGPCGLEDSARTVFNPPNLHLPHFSPPHAPAHEASQPAIDPFYLLACKLEWEQEQEPSAAWELLAAAQSSDSDTRAHARALLATSPELGGLALRESEKRSEVRRKRRSAPEITMKTACGLEMIETCNGCAHTLPDFFCGFSAPATHSLDQASHKSNLSAGAILFVEGQSPQGIFILCSGRVNLSTTSREGKILILKTAESGEVLGLSAVISGVGYEVTAEAASDCQLNFVDRKHLLELMESHSEISVRAAQSLSRDFQSAYRDIHDLVLTRSSAGKLARLLLSNSSQDASVAETRVRSNMTHEEMAQRIGASRETVTRLLSHLKKKRLIRLEGPILIIRDRMALEALSA